MTSKTKLRYALSVAALAASASMSAQAVTYTNTQVSRWMEYSNGTVGGVTNYSEEFYPSKGYDVRPPAELYTMFPGLVVGDGNNKATSDALWAAYLTSPNAIGNSSTLVRAHDLSSDYNIGLVDPAAPGKIFYGTWYTDKSTSYQTTAAVPLTMVGGPQAGQSALGNNKLLALGDSTSVWLDNDGSLSYYNYFGGTLNFDSTKTALTGGATGWAGASLTSKLGNMIGYEQGDVYFLDGANTIQVYTNDLNFVRTEVVGLTGDLAGKSLADVIDHKVAGYTYMGWDLGPVVVGVTTAVPEASTLAMWLIGGGLLAAGVRKGRKQA